MGYGRRRGRTRRVALPLNANLAMPRGPVSGFAQAADFYDSVGINHHPEYMPDADMDTAIARVQELGLRHLRLGCYSPANHGASDFQYRSGQTGLKVAAANANRAAGVHPILVIWGTTEEPAFEASRGSAIYTITDGDGTFLRPLDGPAGSVSRNPPSGTPLLENAGSYYNQGWETAGGLQGPNEPDNNRTTYWGESGGNPGVRETLGALKSAKNARTGEVVVAAADYIDSTTGRITQGPAHAPQLPVVGPHLVGNNWANFGSAATVVPLIDAGNRHTYWGGHGPNYTELVGQWDSSTSYTGAPRFCTETGYRQRVSWASTGENVLGAERYTPPDASGEYMIRTLVHNYLQGVRRTYLYKLNDESTTNTAPWIYGIHDYAWTRRASFYAIKNLMTLVGWTQGPSSVPLPVTVSGFTPGTSYTIGGGDGYVMPDRLDTLVLQRSEREYIVILCRQRELWDRGLQQDITVSDPQTVTLTFGRSIATAAVAEPAKNGVESPSDGATYSNPSDGTAYASLTVTNGNSVSLAVRGLTRVVKVVTAPDDPVQDPQLLWVPDYSTPSDTVQGIWYREQEPRVRGVLQTDRAKIVSHASLPGQGQTYTPAGNGLRVELRPYHTASDFTVAATAPATSSATAITMSAGDVSLLADKDFMLNQRTSEMLRVSGAPSGTTVNVLRGQRTTPQAIETGDTFLISTGDISDSGSATNGYATNRTEVYDRFPATGGSTPPANWPDPVGSVRWYGYSVLFASPFTFSSSWWFTLTQFKGQYGGSPPRAVEIRQTNKLFWAGTRGGRDLGTIVPDTWTRLVIGVRWEASSTDGWSTVYRDGVLKVPKTYEATMDTYGGGQVDPVYLKEGIYRTAAWDQTHVLYYGPIKVGTTMADVASP